MTSKALVYLGLLAALLLGAGKVHAQHSNFTYQGALADDSGPASGTYDFRFRVFDAESGGNQVGIDTLVPGLWVTEGIFTATVNPGPDVFNGQGRWLQIEVRTNGAPAFASIQPRHLLAATPYAYFAWSAATAESIPASGITGTLPEAILPQTVITNGSSGVQLSGVFSGDGSGLTGVDVAPTQHLNGGDSSAVPNSIYLAEGTARSQVILPSTGTVGERIQISGVGSGGWSLFGKIVGHPSLLDSLTPRIGAAQWTHVASSTDGLRIATTRAAGFLHTSTDGGVTWTEHDLANLLSVREGKSGFEWHSLACSADGTRVVGSGSYLSNVGRKGIMCMTSNGGVAFSFAATPDDRILNALAVTADAQTVHAADEAGSIFFSIDGAQSWVGGITVSSRPVLALASSSDGQRIVAVSPGNGIINWSEETSWYSGEPVREWTSVASSADGSHLLAASQGINGAGDSLYVSTDHGSTWEPRGPTRAWRHVASSSDGSVLYAVPSVGGIFVSTDGGQTWTESAIQGVWSDIECSGNGYRVIASNTSSPGNSNGRVYTSNPFSGGTGDSIDLRYAGEGYWQPTTPISFSLDAAKITSGTLPNARLSADVARRSGGNAFQGDQTFTGGVVGIGTTSPTTQLHVKQRTDNSGLNRANDGIILENSISAHYWVFQTQTAGDLVFDCPSGGGYAYLSANNGTFHTSSDERLKKNVRPMNSLLDRALRLEPVTFQYKDSPDDNRSTVGFIAQQVRPLFPEVVDEKDGYLALSYSGFGPIAIGAIRELHAKFETDHAELGRRLEAKEAEIADLKSRLERMERALANGNNGGVR